MQDGILIAELLAVGAEALEAIGTTVDNAEASKKAEAAPVPAEKPAAMGVDDVAAGLAGSAGKKRASPDSGPAPAQTKSKTSSNKSSTPAENDTASA